MKDGRGGNAGRQRDWRWTDREGPKKRMRERQRMRAGRQGRQAE